MKKQKLYRFKNSIEVEEYRDGRFGAKGEKRHEKRKVTPEQVKRQNQFNRTKKLRRMIKANFKENDLYWTLTFRKEVRPGSIDEAKEIWKKIQRKLRDECKSQKLQFKWVVRIEKGSKGAVHIHLIMNAIEKSSFVKNLWKEFGHARLEFMYEDGGFADLAAYMTKPDTEGEESYYSHSRNLPIPEPEVNLIAGEIEDEEIKIPEGYYLDKESLIEGINPITGYPYRQYTLLRWEVEDVRSKCFS